jgi:hypothetical protein
MLRFLSEFYRNLIAVERMIDRADLRSGLLTAVDFPILGVCHLLFDLIQRVGATCLRSNERALR